MKFDLVITNPPYNNYIDLNILESLHDISNEFIVIHPCPYLMKNTFDTNDTLKEFINRTSGTVKSIEFLDGWDTFAIENPSPCVIIHYNKKLVTDCDVSFTQDIFSVINLFPTK
jgi:DNA modification methylase